MRKIRLEKKRVPSRSNLRFPGCARKGGQVWVETVVYTLIGLTIIGILLAVSTPRINEMRDRMRINEAVDIIGQIDAAIIDAKSAPGNVRILDVEVSKGTLVINGTNNSVYWLMDSSYEYSQPGETIPLGDLKIITTQTGGNYDVKILREYSYNINADGTDNVMELEVASIPYNLKIQSSGSYGEALAINFSVGG